VGDWITAAVTAVACFGLSGVCAFHLYQSAKRVRWSRSERRLVTRHPSPIVFWTKFGIVAGGAFLGLAMGILLLLFHNHHPFQPSAGNRSLFENVPATPGENR
jgi:hypothetical protein